eukprot:scaffold43354_cov58-Phaeocystis_antarctica.AAC.2
MERMSVTLEVSKLSGWLNDDAYCRVGRRAYDVGRGAEYREAGGGGRPRCTRRAGEGSTADWGQGTRGEAHFEHAPHVGDTGGVEAQRLRLVERRRAVEHCVHGCDAGDVPIGNEAVRRSGGSWVSVVGLDRRLQGGRGRECGRAGPRPPARAIASRGEGRGARPRATDEQLVGVGQGACGLPSRKGGMRCGMRRGPEGGRACGGRRRKRRARGGPD